MRKANHVFVLRKRRIFQLPKDMVTFLVSEEIAVPVENELFKIVFSKKNLKRYILKESNFICYFCGNDANQIMRLIRKRDGGLMSPKNAVSCCSFCKEERGAMTAEEYVSYLYPISLEMEPDLKEEREDDVRENDHFPLSSENDSRSSFPLSEIARFVSFENNEILDEKKEIVTSSSEKSLPLVAGEEATVVKPEASLSLSNPEPSRYLGRCSLCKGECEIMELVKITSSKFFCKPCSEKAKNSIMLYESDGKLSALISKEQANWLFESSKAFWSNPKCIHIKHGVLLEVAPEKIPVSESMIEEKAPIVTDAKRICSACNENKPSKSFVNASKKKKLCSDCVQKARSENLIFVVGENKLITELASSERVTSLLKESRGEMRGNKLFVYFTEKEREQFLKSGFLSSTNAHCVSRVFTKAHAGERLVPFFKSNCQPSGSISKNEADRLLKTNQVTKHGKGVRELGVKEKLRIEIPTPTKLPNPNLDSVQLLGSRGKVLGIVSSESSQVACQLGIVRMSVNKQLFAPVHLSRKQFLKSLKGLKGKINSTDFQKFMIWGKEVDTLRTHSHSSPRFFQHPVILDDPSKEPVFQVVAEKVLIRDDHICYFCGKNVANGNMALFKPLHEGGKIELSNAVTCCVSCEAEHDCEGMLKFLNIVGVSQGSFFSLMDKILPKWWKRTVLMEEMNGREQRIFLNDAERLVSEGMASWKDENKIVLLFNRDSLFEYVYARDNNTCYICNKTGNTMDHVFPRSKGGLSTPLNLKCACRKCNGEKSSLALDEYLEKKKNSNAV